MQGRIPQSKSASNYTPFRRNLQRKGFVKSCAFFTSPGQDHLSLMPLLYKFSNKLSENATLCNSPNILASQITICHQLILISCALQPPAQEKREKKHCRSVKKAWLQKEIQTSSWASIPACLVTWGGCGKKDERGHFHDNLTRGDQST